MGLALTLVYPGKNWFDFRLRPEGLHSTTI